MKLWGRQRRRFYRHPIEAPIQLELANSGRALPSKTLDISLGGLCFNWSDKLPKNAFVTLTIPVAEKFFDVHAKIVYTKQVKARSDYRVGVMFTDFPSAFKAKLAEEILRIHEFRNKLSRTLGSELTEEEAASRWIADYAKKFSDQN